MSLGVLGRSRSGCPVHRMRVKRLDEKVFEKSSFVARVIPTNAHDAETECGAPA